MPIRSWTAQRQPSSSRRFRAERSNASDTAGVERRAARLVGVILVLIGAYLVVAGVTALANHSHPEHTALGVALTAASILVLPALARAKLTLAKHLDSSALHGDGMLSLAGAALAAATLVSLLLDSAVGWWWADPVAAVLIAGTLLREGCLILGTHKRPCSMPGNLWIASARIGCITFPCTADATS